MTNRQSNIIFYSIVSMIIFAIVINYIYPEFFANLNKSKEQLSIQEAMKQGQHGKALSMYEELEKKEFNNKKGNSIEKAISYEEMAKLYSLRKDQIKVKEYFLKSLHIREKLEKTDVLGLIILYDKLGELAESEKKYDEAQQYYQKSLSKKLGNTQKEESSGMFMGMKNTRERYTRLNNELTINTLKKLAEIHEIKREYAIAKNYYEKALTASKLTFGEDDLKTQELMRLMNQLDL